MADASSTPGSDASPATVRTASPDAVVPPVAPTAAARISGASLMLLLAAGLISTVVAVFANGLDLLADGVTRPAFLQGETMRGIASALAKAPSARTAAQLEREGSFMVMRDLGPQVREGCRGWLFLAEELAPQSDANAHLEARAQAVERVQAMLSQRGIHLVIALVPDKSRIARDQLCGLARPAAVDGRAVEWVRRMAAAGVVTVDLTVPLAALKAAGAEPFLRTDTHWTAEGAEVSARAVADVVRRFGLQALPPHVLDVTTAPAARRPGDLVRLAGIDGLPLSLQPAPEDAVVRTFTPRTEGTATGGTAPAGQTEADLFGDSALPGLALIGTSFSRTSHFADFLARDLGTPVPNLARDGGNFWGAAGAYFNSPAFRDTPPKLVVWEVPERALQLPIAGEQWRLP